MNIPILAEFERLITEHGSVTIQGHHIALLKDQLSRFEKENEALKKQNAKLIADVADYKRQLERYMAPADCIEWNGVLIKRLPAGNYSESPLCPACKIALSVTPTRRLFCHRCDYLPSVSLASVHEHIKTLS